MLGNKYHGEKRNKKMDHTSFVCVCVCVWGRGWVGQGGALFVCERGFYTMIIYPFTIQSC